jgi:hypothetical protein
MLDHNLPLVSVETEILRSRIDLVSKDDQSTFRCKSTLQELRNLIKVAILSQSQKVSLPHSLFQELEEAYVALF